MAYQAMARRYRPSTFDGVIGQEHISQTLKNAITLNRVAHAYLFCGPHGVGKTSMARIFAKALNCTDGPSVEIPTDCPICADIDNGNDPDVQEIDGASNNSVDQIRTLREQVGYVPARAKHKIYIIDEVHMLSTSAFNALLKTLEEPPAHVKFILATTEPQKLLETVLSRCQRFDFRLVQPQKISTYLKELCKQEKVKANDDALEAIAAFSNGSMRDGLVLLDQLISYCPEIVTREEVEKVKGAAGIESVIAIFDAIVKHDSIAGLKIVDEIAMQGISVGDFFDQLISYGRDLMLCNASKSMEKISTYGPAKKSITEHSKNLSLEQILLCLDVFINARIKVKSRALANPLVPLEMAVARLSGLEHTDSIENTIARIEDLAKSGALSGGIEFAGNISSDEKAEPMQKKNEGEEKIAKDNTPKPPSEPNPEPQSQETAIDNPPPKEEKVASENECQEPKKITLEDIKQKWGEFFNLVKERYKPDTAYLHDIKPIAFDDGKLTIELPAGGVFLFENIEEKSRHKRITEAMSDTFGVPITFFMKIAEGDPTNHKTSKKPSSEAMSDPNVQKLIEKFGCELLNIE